MMIVLLFIYLFIDLLSLLSKLGESGSAGAPEANGNGDEAGTRKGSEPSVRSRKGDDDDTFFVFT
jgi:hypothetical protein